MMRERPVRARTVDQPIASIEEEPAGPIEQQLGRLEEQLDELRAQVRQAQQLASLGTAAAMIAHEVSNLLTPVMAYAKTALSTDNHDLQRKALSVTIKHVQMLVAMSDRVLEISAAKAASFERVSLQEVVESAFASLCRDPSKDGISTKVQIDEAAWAWVDPLNLQQVLFNLFLNARDAMAPSHTGCLAVSAIRKGDQIAIEVRDTGPGIDPELLPHIFDPLTTSKPADRNGRKRCGGLGLALCRDLIEENGGTISVASKPGAGTTFTILIPAFNPPSE